MTLKKTENATKFLQRVREVYKGDYKIYFILDNWSVHKTKAFKRTAKELNIEPHYIPTSAPYFNRIERGLFGKMQRELLNGSNFEDINELKKSIVEYVDETFNKDAYHNNNICLLE